MGVSSDLSWIDKLRVADLKDELDKRGVNYKKSLKKAELAEILVGAVQNEVQSAPLSSTPQEPAIGSTPQKPPTADSVEHASSAEPAKVTDVPVTPGMEGHGVGKDREPDAQPQPSVASPAPQSAAPALQPTAAEPVTEAAEAVPPVPATDRGTSAAAAKPELATPEHVQAAQPPHKQPAEAKAAKPVPSAEEPKPDSGREKASQNEPLKTQEPVQTSQVVAQALDGKAPPAAPMVTEQSAKRDEGRTTGGGPAERPTSTPGAPPPSAQAEEVVAEAVSNGKHAASDLGRQVENGEAAAAPTDGKVQETPLQMAEPAKLKEPVPKPKEVGAEGKAAAVATPIAAKAETAGVSTAIPAVAAGAETASVSPAVPAEPMPLKADGPGFPAGSSVVGKGKPPESPAAAGHTGEPTPNKEPVPLVTTTGAETKAVPARPVAPPVEAVPLPTAAVEVETAALDMLEEPAVEEQLDYGEETEDAVVSQPVAESGKVGTKRPHADSLEAQKPAKLSKTAGAADAKAKVAEKKQRDEKGADKIVRELKVDKKAVEEKPKTETVRKRKYSPIPAPPSKADREKAKEKEKAREKKGKEEPETERSKRHKGSPEAAAKGSTAAVKPAVLDRLAKKGSVFDRLANGTKAPLVDGKAELVPAKLDVAKKDKVEEPAARAIPRKEPTAKRVPPSKEKPSIALRIDGFVRPLHEKMVRELLSETGTLTNLWMPGIKTHAYAVFSSKEEAEATRQAVYDVEWPEGRQNRLKPKFVPLEEAAQKISLAGGVIEHPDVKPSSDKKANGIKDAREIIKGREAGAPGKNKEGSGKPAIEVEKVLDLDVLFKKTAQHPPLYWLPLTDEQVAAKAAAAAAAKAAVKAA